jgi:hypothetical protein
MRRHLSTPGWQTEVGSVQCSALWHHQAILGTVRAWVVAATRRPRVQPALETRQSDSGVVLSRGVSLSGRGRRGFSWLFWFL